MAVAPVYKIISAITSKVIDGGFAVQLAPTGFNHNGGIITNPGSAYDQGILVAEALFISLLGPPGTVEDSAAGTSALIPGQSFFVPAGSFVWVNAVTSGHAFSATFFISSTAVNPIPTPVPPAPGGGIGIGTFGGALPWPPGQPTGMTKVIPSYAYQEYSDDDDIQAFVKSQNVLQQNYIDTFNALNLPIYTGPLIAGPLLDWVAMGIYGYKRPLIFSPRIFVTGPVNTYGPNFNVPINMLRVSRPQNAVVSDDDFYKRCLTWHYQKGDGRYFNVRWLKRRIMRFLIGVNGSSPHVDQTNQISVTFGPNYECTIRFVLIVRTVVGGALPNRFGPNGTRPSQRLSIVLINGIFTTSETLLPLPYMDQFANALATGALELPFQFNYVVVIG